MIAKETGKKFIIRLEKGEEIIKTLMHFLDKKNIRSGHFFGIGAVSFAELAHYDLDSKQYSSKKIDEPLEVLSLIGNIAVKDKEIIIHSHVTLSDKKMNCMGGHLKEAVVAATIEIVLVPLDDILKRKYDEEIGLNLLDI